MLRTLTLLAVLVLYAFPAFAQWPSLGDVPKVKASKTQDVAIIVAVEDYLLLPDVDGAVANANEWELFFQNGLKIPNIHVLANQDATVEEMTKFAKTAAQDVGENGTIWWIFIGHGAPSVDGKDGLMIGMDAQQTVDSLTSRGLPQQELLKALRADKNKTVLIVDACFSGRSSDGDALAAGVQPVIAVDSTKNLGANAVILSAAKATEVAGQLDGTKRPAFSYLMLGALRGWADDGDGKVTAKEALFYSRRVLRGVKGRQQTPQASGNLKLVLSRGVTENEPKAIADGVEAADCKEGEARVNGKCVKQKVVASGDENSKAAATLEYLKRRITFDGKSPQQAGRELEGPAFYHAINRPDLADKWMGHNPYLWVPGIIATVGGVALLSYGIGQATGESDSTAWFFGGFFGGFFTMSGGIAMITFGFIGEKHPMSLAKRKSAATAFNQDERESRGLGPEVDWQNPPPKSSKKGMFNIFGSNMPELKTPSIGITVRF